MPHKWECHEAGPTLRSAKLRLMRATSALCNPLVLHQRANSGEACRLASAPRAPASEVATSAGCATQLLLGRGCALCRACAAGALAFDAASSAGCAAPLPPGCRREPCRGNTVC